MSAKEALLEILKSAKKASLINIKSGDGIILIGTKNEWNDAVFKNHKAGYISSKVYNNNIETFNRLDVLKENVAYIKNEMENRKDTIKDFSGMLNQIENDPFYQRAYAQRKQMYVDGLKKAQTEYPKYKTQYKNELILLRETQQKVKNIVEESLKQMKI